MKQMHKGQMKNEISTHIFEGILPGTSIYSGGLSFMEKDEISHANDKGSPVHVHDDCELFYFFQGKAAVDVDGVRYPAGAGDIFLIEPGEDHHIIADGKEPPIVLWCHAKEPLE